MLFIDTHNLFHCANMRFKNQVLDYEKLFDHLVTLHPFLSDARPTVYVQKTQTSDGFVTYLRQQFTAFVRMKQIRSHKLDNFDVDLTIDALACESTNIVICSSSMNLLPLLAKLHDQKKNVYVDACGIPGDFQHLCIKKEIPRSILRKVENEAPATA